MMMNLRLYQLFFCKSLFAVHWRRQIVAFSSYGDQHKKQRYKYKKKPAGPPIPVPDFEGEPLWGIHPVKNAILAERRKIYHTYINADTNNERLVELQHLCARNRIDVIKTTRPVLDTLAGNHPHQGVCMDVSPLPGQKLCVETHMKSLHDDNGHGQVWILPYQIQDTMNMGAVIRSAFFFGVSQIILPSRFSSALNGVVSKASAGSLELSSILTLGTDQQLGQILQHWRSLGGKVVGSTSNMEVPRAQSVYSYQADSPTLLIIGNEAKGIHSNLSDLCDVLLYIEGSHPAQLSGEQVSLDSLNVSVATGILLHSIMRSHKQQSS